MHIPKRTQKLDSMGFFMWEDSVFFKGLITGNLAMLQWVYGQQKLMCFAFLLPLSLPPPLLPSCFFFLRAVTKVEGGRPGRSGKLVWVGCTIWNFQRINKNFMLEKYKMTNLTLLFNSLNITHWFIFNYFCIKETVIFPIYFIMKQWWKYYFLILKSRAPKKNTRNIMNNKIH